MAKSEYVKEPPMRNMTVRVPGIMLDKAKEMNLNVSKIVRDALAKEVNVKSRRKSASV